MSCYSVAEEITSIRADYLVELRGFEPLTFGVGAPTVSAPSPPRLNLARGCSLLWIRP
jgi:hypothetical protein